MSRMIDDPYPNDFELGEIIEFDSDGERLRGRVVRVYSTRLNYHVEVDGQRYEVEVPDDNPKRVR
jgi:hypothetical protein